MLLVDNSPSFLHSDFLKILNGQVIGDALRAAAKLGAVGALVCTDGASYGGTHGDLRAACAMSDALGGPGPDGPSRDDTTADRQHFSKM